MERGNIGIYCIKNSSNGKCYIGKSVQLNWRLKDHKKRLNGGYHFNEKLQRAWLKYGSSSFLFYTLELCGKKDLCSKEVEWIKKLDSRRNGYNMTDGGDGSLGRPQGEVTREKLRRAFLGKPGHKHTEEHKLKMSRMLSGKNNPMHGKSPTDETRNKQSLSLKELYSKKPHHSIGAKASKETRAKMSAQRRGDGNAFYGKKHSEESRKKMTEKRLTMYKGGDNPRAKKVVCGDQTFKTMKDCAKYLGVCKTSIYNWLYGKNKIPEKYKHLNMRFAEDDANEL